MVSMVGVGPGAISGWLVGWLVDNCFVFPILFCSTNTKDIAVLGAISGWLVSGQITVGPGESLLR